MLTPALTLRRRTLLGLVAAFAAMPGCVRGGDATVSPNERPTTGPIVRRPRPGTPPSSGNEIPASDSGTGRPLPSVEPGASGRVRDRAGRPLAQVFVQAMGAGPGDPPVPEMAVFTNERGFWHWSLRPGRYVLTFSLAGRSSAQRIVQVGAGQNVEVDVVLD